MQTTILKKILTELEAKTPRLDYIRGMLETMVEMEKPTPLILAGQTPFPSMVPTATNALVLDDESAILDARAKASLQKVRQMSTE